MKICLSEGMRALGRAGLIIYLTYLSVSVAPVTLKVGHTDGRLVRGICDSYKDQTEGRLF